MNSIHWALLINVVCPIIYIVSFFILKNSYKTLMDKELRKYTSSLIKDENKEQTTLITKQKEIIELLRSELELKNIIHTNKSNIEIDFYKTFSCKFYYLYENFHQLIMDLNEHFPKIPNNFCSKFEDIKKEYKKLVTFNYSYEIFLPEDIASSLKITLLKGLQPHITNLNLINKNGYNKEVLNNLLTINETTYSYFSETRDLIQKRLNI